MRVLVVEDSDKKRERVVQALRDEFNDTNALYVAEAIDYEDATEKLGAGFYDLVVMDLKLPAAGADASEQTSKELIRRLLRGDRMLPPTQIIGLTEFAELCNTEGAFYDENLFALIVYDAVDDNWRNRLCAKIRYLAAAQSAAARFAMNSYDFDVVVLAARHANEYAPMINKLFVERDDAPHPLWSGDATFGAILGPNGRKLRGALICVGEMGMAPTAAVAAQAIHIFRPKLLAMVGMCCGFAGNLSASPRRLADVIIAREVACWEEGKYQASSCATEGDFRNRAKTRLVNDVIRHEIERIVEAGNETLLPQLARLSRTAQYKKFLQAFPDSETREVPDVRFAPMVSGSSVVAEEGVIVEILDRHTGAIGLDMELYGLYAAVDRATGVKPAVVGIKGVADFGSADKGDAAQRIATAAATEVFLSILRRLTIFAAPAS